MPELNETEIRALEEALDDDLNTYNDAYPLARPSQAAAIATLHHEDEVRARAMRLRTWARALAAELRTLGVRVASVDGKKRYDLAVDGVSPEKVSYQIQNQ